VQLFPERLAEPLSWHKPRAVAVSLMGDLFHEDVSFGFIDGVWDVMYRCPQHVFHVLTKRAARMAAYVRNGIVLPNLRLGTSIENQETADERILHLLKCPGVHFVSYEPALDGVNVLPWIDRLDWLIAGHESGDNRRPGNLEHVESIVNQCATAGVPIYVKQIHVNGKLLKVPHGGEYPPEWPAHLRVREFPQ
jgi:protein gp37